MSSAKAVIHKRPAKSIIKNFRKVPRRFPSIVAHNCHGPIRLVLKTYFQLIHRHHYLIRNYTCDTPEKLITFFGIFSGPFVTYNSDPYRCVFYIQKCDIYKQETCYYERYLPSIKVNIMSHSAPRNISSMKVIIIFPIPSDLALFRISQHLTFSCPVSSDCVFYTTIIPNLMYMLPRLHEHIMIIKKCSLSSAHGLVEKNAVSLLGMKATSENCWK